MWKITLKFSVATATVTLLLASVTKRVVIAQDQQCNEYRFDAPFFPGNSCEDIYHKNLQTHYISGYYWITDGPSRVYCGMGYYGLSCEDVYIKNVATRNKSGYYRINNNEWVYCNMTAIAIAFSRGDLISSCVGVDGTWKRIANFNITAGDNCPFPWVKISHNGVSFCIGSTAAGCYSVNYSTNGMSYQRVCGRASGYQKGTTDGFQGGTIDNAYIDGLSITHGSPRQHIWTYAMGFTDSGDFRSFNCPCTVFAGPNPPTFVGSHYYCESGANSTWAHSTYYLSDILWDGAGCSANNTCCSDPNLPWFYRQLSQTTQDDIEVRACMDAAFDNEAVLITNVELYVQAVTD